MQHNLVNTSNRTTMEKKYVIYTFDKISKDHLVKNTCDNTDTKYKLMNLSRGVKHDYPMSYKRIFHQVIAQW